MSSFFNRTIGTIFGQRPTEASNTAGNTDTWLTLMKISSRAVLALVGLLLVRVGLLAIDPRVYSNIYGPLPNSPWHPLTQSPWDWAVDGIYTITNILVWPAAWAIDQWSNWSGQSAMGSINQPAAETLRRILHGAEGVSTEQARQLVLNAPGVVDGAALATVVMLLLIGVALPWLVRYAQGLYWQWWTEWHYRQEQDDALQNQLLAQKQAMAGMSRDLSAMQETATLLYRQNVTDPLTQLYNKRFFTEKLDTLFQAQLKRGQPFGLMMLDIDHFKPLNDTYGHPVGDVVLKEVSAVIKQHTPGHCFACRYGGEEFGILFSQQSLASMRQTASHIRNGIQELTFEQHPEITVTISQGLAGVFPGTGTVEITSSAALLETADKALYHAKENGRNRLSETLFGDPQLTNSV